MRNNLKTLLGYLLEEETVSQRPFMLSIDNLVAHRDSLFDAYEHCVYRNRCSESSGPIVVAEIEDGKYQLIDGYHRLIEHLLDRGGLVPIHAIVGGEGTGEYAIARGVDRWLGDASMRYGNLEDLTDEETLEGHANKRKNAKKGDLFENGVGGGEDIWYHTTSRENAEKILREGLRINPSGKGKSRASLQWMPEAYGGITPIFISRKPGRYVNGVILKVDVSGLDLVADIPGLVDFDGRLTDHSIYWDEEETPEIIWDLMDPETGESVNGELEFEWLREPGNDISRAAIELTGTAAVMEDIEPSRIELTEMIVEKNT